MKKHIKKLSWLTSLLFVLAPLFSGCGIFYPAQRDGNGYYIKHFTCCGPTAMEVAINEYYRKTAILKEYYQQKDRYYGINGKGQIDEIFIRLKKVIDSL